MRANFTDGLDSIHVRHEKVGDDEIEVLLVRQRHACSAVGCIRNTVSRPLENSAGNQADRPLVIDDEDQGHVVA